MTRFRDFHVKNYKNPFFTKQKRTKVKLVFALIGIFIFLAGITYVVIFSPLFKISSIEVVGTKNISVDELREIANRELSNNKFGLLPGDNIFFLNLDDIKKNITSASLLIRSIDVSVHFKKITIKINELEASMRLVQGTTAYILDQEGRIMKIAGVGEGDALVAISFSDSSKVFSVGDIVLSTTQIDFVKNLHKYFATQAGIRDQIIVIDQVNTAFNVMTTEGWYAVFDPDIDLDTQLKSLNSVLVGKFNPEERKNLLYIDTRFGDRIFYKTK